MCIHSALYGMPCTVHTGAYALSCYKACGSSAQSLQLPLMAAAAEQGHSERCSWTSPSGVHLLSFVWYAVYGVPCIWQAACAFSCCKACGSRAQSLQQQRMAAAAEQGRSVRCSWSSPVGPSFGGAVAYAWCRTLRCQLLKRVLVLSAAGGQQQGAKRAPAAAGSSLQSKAFCKVQQ